MLYPAIEKCVDKVGGKYALTIIAAKRALELKEKMPAEFQNSRTKEITYALNEVASGKIVKATTLN